MSTSDSCRSCGAIVTGGRALCRPCMRAAVEAARTVIALDGPLDAIIRREANRTTGGGGHARPSEAPDPVRLGLLERAMAWQSDIDGISAALDGDRGRSRSLAHAARRLFASGALGSGIAADAKRALETAARGMEAACDPPAPREVVGLCPADDAPVWAAPGEQYGECAQCGARVHRTQVSDALAARIASDTRRGYPSDIRRMCAAEGVTLPAATIRTWIRRGELTRDAAGMIALADVAALLLRRDRTRRGKPTD